MESHSLVSKRDGSIDPFILGRDFELQISYDLLSAKYEALLKECAKMQEEISAANEIIGMLEEDIEYYRGEAEDLRRQLPYGYYMEK